MGRSFHATFDVSGEVKRCRDRRRQHVWYRPAHNRDSATLGRRAIASADEEIAQEPILSRENSGKIDCLNDWLSAALVALPLCAYYDTRLRTLRARSCLCAKRKLPAPARRPCTDDILSFRCTSPLTPRRALATARQKERVSQRHFFAVFASAPAPLVITTRDDGGA